MFAIDSIVTDLVLGLMATPTQTVSEASAPPSDSHKFPNNPLFDDPDADITLRSSDDHEFRILKFYIIKVSPVLRKLIESASSSHAANAPSFPTIQLSDSGATLSCLLTFIFPMPPVLPPTIQQTMLLLSAAQKYQMDLIMSRIRAVVASQDPPFIRPETAFEVYSFAQTYGLREETLHAARTTLNFPFTLEDLEGELGSTCLDYLHELWSYHSRVRTYLADDLTAFKATGIPSAVTTQPCKYGTLTWLCEYITSIAKSPALFDLTEFHMYLSSHITSWHCQCGKIPSKAIHAFWTALTNVVHSCMTKVSVDGLRNYMVPVTISMFL